MRRAARGDDRSMRSRLSVGVLAAVLLSFGLPPRAPAAAQRHVFETVPGGPELRVARRARAGIQPKSVTVSPDGSEVWVCNFGTPGYENVTIHDPVTLERIGVVEFDGNAVEVVFAPDGRTAWVSNFRRAVVHEVDVRSRRVRREIEVGANPKMMAVSPDGGLLYVANWSGGNVSVVDVRAGHAIREIETGRHPRGLAVHPDGRVYVASFHGRLIQELSAGGERELRRIETHCALPRHLVVDPEADRLYVTCTLPGSITWYDLSTGRRAGLAESGRNPRTLDVSRDGRWAATANFHFGDVTLADLRAGTHRTHEVEGADKLVGLAIHPGGRLRIYVTSWTSHELIALELAE